MTDNESVLWLLRRGMALRNSARLATASGVDSVTVTNPRGTTLKSLTITGNSVQNGTPSPTNPVAIGNVGDLIVSGDYACMYMLPIVITGTGGRTATVTLYMPRPLRLGDTLEVVGGVGDAARAVRAFDGTETIYVSNTIDIDRFYYIGLKLRINGDGVCTHFLHAPNNNNRYDNGYFYIRPSVAEVLGFEISAGLYTTETFKSYLAAQYAAGTPVTVEYETAEHTPFTVDGAAIPLFDGTNVFTVGTAVQPTAMTAQYYTKG